MVGVETEHRAWLSVGSNMGDKVGNCLAGIAALTASGRSTTLPPRPRTVLVVRSDGSAHETRSLPDSIIFLAAFGVLSAARAHQYPAHLALVFSLRCRSTTDRSLIGESPSAPLTSHVRHKEGQEVVVLTLASRTA